MRRRVAAATTIVAAAAPAASADHGKHVLGCATVSCDKRIGARWARKHKPKLVASSTSYCPGSSGSTMADGRTVHIGAVASNRHPLGTRIRLIGQRFMGRVIFTVEDRIGAYSDLDLWAPSCATSRAWGRRTVRYVVVG